MVRHFDGDLAALEKRVLDMGALCETMIQKAVRALVDRNSALTQEVFELEKSANAFHIEIDDTALTLVALHQPMAVDLRFLAAVMKINSDLERVADMTVNACQTGYYHLFHEPPMPQINMVTGMATVAQSMLRNSLDAFAKKDAELARRVLDQEKEEDRLKAEALKALIALIRSDPPHSEIFVDLILLSKNMERIGDHATNIAEDVIFMVRGEDIRHRSQLTGR